MRKTEIVSWLVVTAALAMAPGYARAWNAAPLLVMNEAGAEADDASLYADGTRAINESHWQEAAGIFQRVAEMHGEHAEGALYWEAYAENKGGQPGNALRLCGELRTQHPKSRWLEECGALEIEIRGKSGNPVSPQGEPDENLKLLAVNALMQQDAAQAVPILQKILAGNQSKELKSRALFVLAQSHSPQAQALLNRVAQGESGQELQIRAIRMIASAQGKQAEGTLATLYQQSKDVQVKRAILQAYLITGTSQKVLEAARHESDPELMKTAAQTLGAMGAVEELMTIYRSSNSAQTKDWVINGLMASGKKSVPALTEIVQSETDAGLRRKAIRDMGVAGGMSVAPTLVTAYQKNGDVESKHAAAQGLFLANDAHDLVALARAEKDPKLKEYLVQQLSLMQNDEAKRYMLEILNQ